MKPEKLAAIEWPAGYCLELKSASFGSMFDDMPAHIQKFLEATIRARYLPSGVQMILVANVEPLSSALSFGANGIVAKHLETVKTLMSEVATWNKKHKLSFFQRITNEYVGPSGTVGVFQRGPGTVFKESMFHVAQFCFEGVTDTPPPFVAYTRQDYEVLNLKDSGLMEDDALPVFPVTLRLSSTDDGFGSVARAIAADSDYINRIGALIPHSNLILADPRTLHGRPELQRRLGTLGLNVLVHPHIPITKELVTRVFLLADRLNTLFHFSVVSHLEGESIGTERAFWMVSHSLGNAISHHPEMPEKMEAVLTVEKWNVKGAELLSNRGPLSNDQLIRVGRGEIASILSLALNRPWEIAFAISLSCLDGLAVDPRFLAVLIELGRNQRKSSKSHNGSLDVALLRTGWARVTACSDCTYMEAAALKNTLNSDMFDRRLKKLRGIQILLMLFDLLCANDSVISFEIGSPPLSQEEDTVVRLPRSGAHLSVSLGPDVRAEFVKAESDGDVVFPVRVAIDGILVSGNPK